tara:strand:+ start:680 stop:919 length:240 start_codon:yes stop_codon:yes gene_type:complete
MKDIITITQALNDLKDFYGLKDIKHVRLDMNDPGDPFITFESNKPDLALFDEHDRHMWPDTMTYKLSLTIISGMFPEED